MNRTLSLSALLFCALFSVNQAFAWGQKGHDTVAYIAENHLTEKTRHAIDSIFDGKSIVYWANWLDNASYQPQHAYTKTWHYKNVDEGIAFDDAPLNPGGDVVRGITTQISALKSNGLSLDETREALVMIVHLVGDMHQPMHMGHASDLGGNLHKVSYFGRDTNLHSVWDSSLLESAHKWSYTEWASQIDRRVDPAIADGSLTDWAKQTQLIATNIYKNTPKGSKLSYNDVARWAPVIEQQLLRGGYRLAAVLNNIFDPQQPQQ